ncbi:MAG: molybdenum cofactor guanylyltransferase MobA, partial [Pseudomonadota bacterium]
DKCLRELAGRPILERLIERVTPQVSTLFINANGDPARFAHYGLNVIADPIDDQPGPLAGVLAGMIAAADSGATAVMSVPGDAPFVPLDLVARLDAARAEAEDRIVLAGSGGRIHPVCGLWPVSLRADLAAALTTGTRKVLDWTGPHDTVSVEFPVGEDGVDPFFNANRPEDLDTAERLIARS